MGIINWMKHTLLTSGESEYKSKVTYDDEYPDITRYVEFKINLPIGERFTDNYKTGYPYTLRELLILIWWLRLKKGRKLNVSTPAYFIRLYTESVSDITKKFIKDNVIYIDNENFVRATEKGQKLYDEFIDLWEIHSQTHAVLDDVYENWNLTKFKIKENDNYIKRLIQTNNYYHDLINWKERHNESTIEEGMYITRNLEEIDKMQRQNEVFKSELNK
ncbi:hypothetical protein [Weissella paramesenteroides]|uniref:hypothetical protein n=1 Tax=Weissella paramesenteroides TaxID=1249 RepID=UPI003981D73D